MYKIKKRKNLDGHTVFRGEEKNKCEGVRSDETKRTRRVIACYCWKEDGHLFQSFLLFGLFPCCCFFFLVLFFFLFCAVSMDSSKVGKCRIACRSCLSRGEKPKQNTHTSYNFHSLKKHWAPTFDRNVVFLFLLFFFFGCFPLCLVGNNCCRHTLFCFKSLVVVDLICSPPPRLVCFTIAPIRVSERLRCRAEVKKKNNKTRVELRAEGTFIGATLHWYGKVHPRCCLQSRLDVLPIIQVRHQNVKKGYTGPAQHTHTHHRREKRTLNCFNIINLSAIWIKLGVVFLSEIQTFDSSRKSK